MLIVLEDRFLFSNQATKVSTFSSFSGKCIEWFVSSWHFSSIVPAVLYEDQVCLEREWFAMPAR